ncbi:hypothetical protein LPTSP4_20710 [Leptospira ryugenii]|uniref:Uncharacterized protein n=1 Tax=Leptospira ryugenii TaxID=1917863 RepID=A0A2P2E0Y7_9LEPT|nr:hypothetical protein LPTSP4_20710 [Leptospira ryugenii]
MVASMLMAGDKYPLAIQNKNNDNTKLGTVVLSIKRICSWMGTEVKEEARIVVSERGDSLSPK